LEYLNQEDVMTGFRVSMRGAVITIVLAALAAGGAERVAAGDQSRQSGSSAGQPAAAAQQEQRGENAAGEAAKPASREGAPLQSPELKAVVEERSDLSSFFDAVAAAGLADALTAGKSYTVFAPTNEAYERAPDADELTNPDNRAQLVGWLRAHIVADDIDPATADTIGKAMTVDGGTITLASEDGTLMVDDAAVVGPSIQQGHLRIYAINGSLSAEPSLAEDDEEEEAE
jgi:uncharacterized surface protein with fasciclin (FAS1) repeats